MDLKQSHVISSSVSYCVGDWGFFWIGIGLEDKQKSGLVQRYHDTPHESELWWLQQGLVSHCPCLSVPAV